jgi:hypothetical protein
MPKTDPAETKQLWEWVYAVNDQLLMMAIPSTASTAVSSRLEGIFIDHTFQFVDVDKHFSQINTATNSKTLGATSIPEDDSYRGLYKVICQIQRNEAYNRHEEFKDAMQTYLAPRHHMPATGGTSTWRSERFLKVDLSRDIDTGLKWQQLKVQSQNQNQQQTNASRSPPPTASITYWLHKQPYSLALDVQLRGRVYFIEGQDNHDGDNSEEVVTGAAVCPYLSIEYQANGENAAQTAARLAEAAGDALYNRFRLHEVQNPGEHLAHDWKNVRHYGITIGWDDFTVWLVEPEEPLGAAIALEVAQVAPIDVPVPHVTTTTTRSYARGKSSVPKFDRGETLHGQLSQRRRTLISALAASAALFSRLPAPPARVGDGTTDNTMSPCQIAQPAPHQNPPNASRTQTRWRGGRMTTLVSASNNRPTIALLAQWIRSIHHWGTTTYADAVERDIMRQETPAGVAMDEGRAHDDLDDVYER